MYLTLQLQSHMNHKTHTDNHLNNIKSFRDKCRDVEFKKKKKKVTLYTAIPFLSGNPFPLPSVRKITKQMKATPKLKSARRSKKKN